MTGGCRILAGDPSQQNERVIRITFRNIPSKGSGTSSEVQMAWIRILPGPHPVLPTAIPPRCYSDIRVSDVSFPLLSGNGSPTRDPNLLRGFSFLSD
jgi:hypothetical protein